MQRTSHSRLPRIFDTPIIMLMQAAGCSDDKAFLLCRHAIEAAQLEHAGARSVGAGTAVQPRCDAATHATVPSVQPAISAGALVGFGLEPFLTCQLGAYRLQVEA